MTSLKSEIISRVDAQLRGIISDSDAGAIIGVSAGWTDGPVIVKRGMANLHDRDPIRRATKFRLGSCGKQMVALGILLLEQDGLLTLDDKVGKYLADFGHLISDTRVGALLNHTHGLRCPIYLTMIAEGLGDPLSIEFGNDLQKRQSARNCKPNERILYSQGGYRLLSIIIERITSIPFEQFLRERLFEPLAMHDTISVRSDADRPPGLAAPYRKRNGRFLDGVYPIELLGEGSLSTTIDDALTWLKSIRERNPIANESTWERFFRREIVNSGWQSNYANGIAKVDRRGIETWEHPGAMTGYRSHLLTSHDPPVDIAVFLNRPDIVPGKLAGDILHLVAGSPKTHSRVDFSEPARDFAGYYASAGTRLVLGLRFYARGATLSISNSSGLALSWHSENLLTGGSVDFGDFRVTLPRDTAEYIDVSHCDNDERYFRIKPLEDDDEFISAVSKLTFYSHDLSAYATFSNDNGWKMEIRGRFRSVTYRLRALALDIVATVQDEGSVRGILSIERGSQNEIKCMTFSTNRSWFLEFVPVALDPVS